MCVRACVCVRVCVHMSVVLNTVFSLTQSEVCHSIQYHIADGSALVREAAVELLGKFVLTKPDLVTQYYDMLIVRMLVSRALNPQSYSIQ